MNEKISIRDEERELQGKTVWIMTGCGKLFITINKKDEKLVEIFLNLGKAGGCALAQSEAVGKLFSVGIQNGVNYKFFVHILKGIGCRRVAFDSVYGKVESCLDGLALVLEKEFGLDNNSGNINGNETVFACEACGSENLVFEGNCYTCQSCAFSKC